jgi:hypothetical protein
MVAPDGKGPERSSGTSCGPLQFLPQIFEERMPHLAFRGFGTVLDFGEQFRLDPGSRCAIFLV